MSPAIDLASCLATIPDRRRAEGKMYSQVGVILGARHPATNRSERIGTCISAPHGRSRPIPRRRAFPLHRHRREDVAAKLRRFGAAAMAGMDGAGHGGFGGGHGGHWRANVFAAIRQADNKTRQVGGFF